MFGWSLSDVMFIQLICVSSSSFCIVCVFASPAFLDYGLGEFVACADEREAGWLVGLRVTSRPPRSPFAFV